MRAHSSTLEVNAMRRRCTLSLILISTLLLINAGFAEAQTVRGKIQWQADDGVRSAARMHVQLCYPENHANAGACSSVYTDPDGMYYFHDVEPGQYELRIRKGGGRGWQRYRIEVSQEEYTDISPITLAPSSEL